MCCGEGGGREREGGGDADTLEVGGGGRSVEFCFGDLLGVRSALGGHYYF